MGFLSRRRSRKEPHLALRGEYSGLSRVAAASVGFLLSYDGDLRGPLVLPEENPDSFRVAMGISGFLSSPDRGLGPYLEFVAGTSGFCSKANIDLGVPMEFQQGVRPHLM